MDFRGRWALRAAASMPVQIIRGKWCKAPGVASPIETSAHGAGSSPRAFPHPPAHTPLPCSLRGPCAKSPRGWVALSKSLDTWHGASKSSTRAWGVQICPHMGGVLTGGKTFLTWRGSPNLPHGRGALPKSSLTWTFWAATPSRHHHVQQPAPLAHYATCPPTPSIMASHVPSPNHVTHLLPRECEATYPGGVTEGRVRVFSIELGLLRAS